MALQKSLQTPYKVSAEYWKVGQIRVDWHNKTCHASVIGFYNLQARTDLAQILQTRTFAWNGDRFTFNVEQALVAQVYAKLKLENEFTGAVDV